nr:HNH endonuclease [Desulfobotulus pelophilus]
MSYKSEITLSKIKEEQTEIFPAGTNKEAFVRVRVNQNFFRKTILASYGGCCITGLSIPELVVASHIVPWSVDEKNRTNPRNGLCLNALHDKAFDAGLISISEDFTVVGSKKLLSFDTNGIELITDSIGLQINMPKRFLPDQNFLSYHRKHIFQG